MIPDHGSTTDWRDPHHGIPSGLKQGQTPQYHGRPAPDQGFRI